MNYVIKIDGKTHTFSNVKSIVNEYSSDLSSASDSQKVKDLIMNKIIFPVSGPDWFMAIKPLPVMPVSPKVSSTTNQPRTEDGIFWNAKLNSRNASADWKWEIGCMTKQEWEKANPVHTCKTEVEFAAWFSSMVN